jgi:hypothetical protein
LWGGLGEPEKMASRTAGLSTPRMVVQIVARMTVTPYQRPKEMAWAVSISYLAVCWRQQDGYTYRCRRAEILRLRESRRMRLSRT